MDSEALAYRIALRKVETPADKLAEVEAEALIYTLAYRFTEVKFETLKDTMALG